MLYIISTRGMLHDHFVILKVMQLCIRKRGFFFEQCSFLVVCSSKIIAIVALIR
ncbi:hypothetical protein DAI22_08g078350 [Oryza sativa Japonica Group]|nr:hypothetical protein DAI22_08g078350 [Oryza sativa Japonica Group]